MRPHLLIAVFCALALGLMGCASYRTPVRPPTGLLMTELSAPLTTNFHRTPVCAKQGSVETTFFREPILTGLSFSWGEAGIREAAANGGLTTVEYADYHVTIVLGIFGKFKVTAYGQ